jgi:hypothetical protein
MSGGNASSSAGFRAWSSSRISFLALVHHPSLPSVVDAVCGDVVSRIIRLKVSLTVIDSLA